MLPPRRICIPPYFNGLQSIVTVNICYIYILWFLQRLFEKYIYKQKYRGYNVASPWQSFNQYIISVFVRTNRYGKIPISATNLICISTSVQPYYWLYGFSHYILYHDSSSMLYNVMWFNRYFLHNSVSYLLPHQICLTWMNTSRLREYESPSLQINVSVLYV